MKQLYLLLFLSTVLTACSGVNPSYRIAYNVLVNGEKDDYDVFTMNPDGSDRKNITRHPDVAWTYMAEGNRLFFISDRDTAYRNYFLYETDAHGNHIRRVSDLRLEDSWMDARKNGDELVVAGRIGREIRYQLFIIDTRTGQFRQITTDTTAMFRDPCFSPNGSTLVFAYKPNKRDRSMHEELYLMDADGGPITQLTTYPKTDTTAAPHAYRAGPPRWHPTDHFISYHSNQQGKASLFAITPDGKKQWKLTKNAENEGWHDWSPDGKWLVMDIYDYEKKFFMLGIQNWETGEFRILQDSVFQYNQAPVFVEK
ncbi:MAG: PD40 domain-containing protein [Bacteroidetes bacterium]|nr:PD40 domain-containing protein [Bacteroidota bacterium]